MSAWKAPLPKPEPDEGKAHFIFAMKGGGWRIELFGQLPLADVAQALQGLIEAQNATHQQRQDGGA